MKKRIVVFGATGNIGVYLTDYLMANVDLTEYDVLAVGRRKTDFFSSIGVKYVKCDITNPEEYEKLPKNNIYAIINVTGKLPAYTKCFDPFDYIETNINGSLRILEYARNTGADRVLYTQTWAEQGDIGARVIFSLRKWEEN